MAKLDAQQLAIAYTGATAVTVIAGAVSAGVWNYTGGNADYALWIGVPWIAIVGVPSVLYAREALVTALGQKPPTRISVDRGKNARSIPLNTASGAGTLFMSVMPGVSLESKKMPLPAPDVFTVKRNGTHYEILLAEVEDFLYAAWRRQRAGKAGLARRYHCRVRRPALRTYQYECIILLVAQARLIANRAAARSGQLLYPPRMSLERLRLAYGLAA